VPNVSHSVPVMPLLSILWPCFSNQLHCYSLRTFLLTEKETSRSLILVSVLYRNILGYDGVVL
jgi:hypothetical protein